MTSEHSTTPANAMTTTAAVARRTSRVALAPTTASFLAMEIAKAEANKKKRRRESNQLRGDKAVELRIASEEKAKSSGEKVKSYVNCCEEAEFLTENARADLSRKIIKMKSSLTDSAMKTPTTLCEDEKEVMTTTRKQWQEIRKAGKITWNFGVINSRHK